MQRINRSLVILFCMLCIGFPFYVVSQTGFEPQQFQDDPIAAALDSLHKLNMFEKGYAKIVYPKNSKYHFSTDSIPRYDDMVYESRLSRLNTASPFDLEYNPAVKMYIEMYAIRKRTLVSKMMALSQLYFPLFEQTLDKYNLPLELKYLAICESALNPLAKSRSGAMGLWQFMYPTGKMFGLRVTSYMDERCDPYKSTIAACEYFKYLYGLFGDWQMVLAAYNCGPGNVNKAIRRSGGKKTYWEIRPFLPTETQGYVPAFIAVNYVMNHTAEHNLHSAIPKKTFLMVDTVKIKKQISFEQISATLNVPLEDVQYLNPIYRKNIIPSGENEQFTLTLPSDKIGLFVANEDSIYSFLSKDIASAANMQTREVKKIHTVKKGEYLTSIAKKYRCSTTDIKTWNHLKSNSVYPGKKLIVYVYETTPSIATANKPSTLPNTSVAKENAIAENKTPTTETTIVGEYKYYTVKKGDSLYRIAQQNNTTIDEIKRLNNMKIKYSLMPGQKLKVGVL
jgi:membrane-bound lytic murein transglycosylase D